MYKVTGYLTLEAGIYEMNQDPEKTPEFIKFKKKSKVC